MAVDEATIRRTLRRLNLKRPPRVERSLPFSKEPEAVVATQEQPLTSDGGMAERATLDE